MQFKWHLLIGFIISYILVFFFDFSITAGVIIFVTSWAIDFDHYFWYVCEFKKQNPIDAIKWYVKSIPKWQSLTKQQKEKFRRGVFVFHSIIFIIILIILSYYYQFFLWILIGVLIHMVADWIDLIDRSEPIYNKLFPYYVIRRNKNKKSLKEL